jgi:rhodanese-related sulfurtransferase
MEDRMKKLFSLLATLVFVFCGMATASAWEYIHADDAYAMLQNDGTYLLDVRTPCEWYYVGHPQVCDDDCASACVPLVGQVFNISYWLWEVNPKTKEYEYNRTPKFFDENVARLFKDGDTIIVMCKTDGRGGYAGTELEDPTTPACQRLEELGTYTVYNLGGGFESPGKVHDGETYVGWKETAGLPYVISAAGAFNPKLGANQGRNIK